MSFLSYFFTLGLSIANCSESTVSTQWIVHKLGEPNAPKTVTEFITSLPEDYRSGFTLMHSSLGVQESSALNPRAILYGLDASLTMAFNGDPSQRGFDRVEMIEFNRPEAKFEFYTLSESPKGGLVLQADSTCVLCHRGDPRPNWQPYDEWPGAYGGDDDRISLGREASELSKFLDLAKTHPRYRTLVDLEKSYSYMDGGKTLTPHNTILAFAFAQLNFARVARLIMDTPQYEKYRYAILGSAGCGGRGFEEFFSEATRPLNRNWTFFAYTSPDAVSPFHYLFESRDIVVGSWAMAIPTVQSRFFRGNIFSSGGQPINEFIAALAGRDKSLAAWVRIESKPYLGISRKVGVVLDCDKLKTMSRLFL